LDSGASNAPEWSFSVQIAMLISQIFSQSWCFHT